MSNAPAPSAAKRSPVLGLLVAQFFGLDLSVTDRHLYVTIGGETLSGEVERLVPA